MLLAKGSDHGDGVHAGVFGQGVRNHIQSLSEGPDAVCLGTRQGGGPLGEGLRQVKSVRPGVA